VCGGDGDVVLEGPAKEGLQHDPWLNPILGWIAALRLRTLHTLNDPLGHESAARETLTTAPVVPRATREMPDFFVMLPARCQCFPS
jgi:hypothetical protein